MEGRATRDSAGRERASLSIPEPSADELLVSAFVAELMAWASHLRFTDKLDRAIDRPTAQPSALARLQQAVCVGILGTGNSGSKGVWSGEGPVDALIDAAEARETLALVEDRSTRWTARVAAMPDELAAVAVWIRDETHGEAPPTQRAGDPPGYVLTYPAEGKRLERRVTGLSLAEVLGLSSAEPLQRARWEGKMKMGDGAAAREGMREAGVELLLACARAWFGETNLTPPAATVSSHRG